MVSLQTDGFPPPDACERNHKTPFQRSKEPCTDDAASLIAAERLQETQSSITHYRAALNCLRELPAVHRSQLGLNLTANFAHSTNVPTTPAEFRVRTIFVELNTNGFRFGLRRNHDKNSFLFVEALQHDLRFGPTIFLDKFRSFVTKNQHFSAGPRLFSEKNNVFCNKIMLYDGNANCIEPVLTFAPSNFRKMQRFFSSAANCQAGTTSIQGEWRKMLSFYNTIRRRVDSLVAQSVQHSSALHNYLVCTERIRT